MKKNLIRFVDLIFFILGCVLYEISCLEPPFFTSNMLALATKITQSDYDHEKLKRFKYSPLVASVVQNCLIVDPLKRPDVVGVAGLVAEKILVYFIKQTAKYKFSRFHFKKLFTSIGVYFIDYF